ncbi:MAG: dTDP-4-dehydrorhamnose 3,5-epimerase [Clostridia bacterium]|nr:dTDP-4-dehydrorhamnose 3,5-epimerase [Clostridia bacterium]
MKIEKTKLKDAFIITPDVFGDSRGWFMETYSKNSLKGTIDIEFVQDNQSYSSKKGIIRGLHCQVTPHCQSKLIRCTKGEIYDVIVDVRQGSPTYKQWIKVLLSSENKKQLFIPKGFLHGFETISDEVEVQYKVDEFYNKECDRSVKFDDPAFGINWETKAPIISEKDSNAPLFKDSDCIFEYEEM